MRLCFWEVLKDGKERNHRAGPGRGPGRVQTGWPLLRAALDPGSPVAPQLEGTGRATRLAALGTVRGPWVPMYGLEAVRLVATYTRVVGKAAGMHLILKTTAVL